MCAETILVLDPTAKANVPAIPIAARPTTLDGKRVGFLHNSKPNGDLLLLRIEAFLSERFALRGVLRRQKPHAAAAMSQEVLDELTEGCDVVINGVGD